MVSILKEGNLVPLSYHTTKEKKQLKSIKPIDYIVSFLKERIGQRPRILSKNCGSRILILKSMTGSGKSTVIGPTLFDHFVAGTRQLIVITQPRVFTAIDIPSQIMTYYKHFKLGENIGYLTGSSKKLPKTGILFETIGELLMQFSFLTDEEICNKFAFIIIDEVHVRDIQTDISLFYLKEFLSRNWENPKCPFVIIMSATMEESLFLNYFKCPKNHYIEVQGLSYHIENMFSRYELADYISYTVDRALQLHIDNYDDVKHDEPIRDMLIFVQGTRDMTDIIKKLNNYNTSVYNWKENREATEYSKMLKDRISRNKIGGDAKNKEKISNYYICPIALDSANYKAGTIDFKNLFADIKTIRVPIFADSANKYYQNTKPTKSNAVNGGTDFKPLSKTQYMSKNVSHDKQENGIEVLDMVEPSRKIIIATNVIETGATINTLKYCFDTGYVRVNEFNPNFGVSLFINKNITREAATQRKGRVGRKKEGEWYPCYTQEIFDSINKYNYPQIINQEITDILLTLIVNETETDVRFAEKKEDGFSMHGDKWILESKYAFDAKALKFIQYPPADNLCYSLAKLYGLGFINHNYIPTIFGWIAMKIKKLRLEQIRMIFAGYTHGAYVLDLITIACMLNTEFSLPKKGYKPRNPLGVKEISAYNAHKILFADENIELLFIWYDFMNLLDSIKISTKKRSGIEAQYDTHKSKKIKISYDNLKSWAKENKFKLAAFYAISKLRDEVIANFLMLGINPYYTDLGLAPGKYHLIDMLNKNMEEGYEEICKIKRCIYEGYRYNIALYDEEQRGYVMCNSHIKINTSDEVTRGVKKDELFIRPRIIAVSDIKLKENMSNDGYEFKATGISVLDGFVNIDLTYNNN